MTVYGDTSPYSYRSKSTLWSWCISCDGMNQRVPPLSWFRPKRSTHMKWTAKGAKLTAVFFCTKDLTISVGVKLTEGWWYGSWSCGVGSNGVGSNGVDLTAFDFIRGVGEEVANYITVWKPTCEWRKWLNHHSYITTYCGGLASHQVCTSKILHLGPTGVWVPCDRRKF